MLSEAGMNCHEFEDRWNEVLDARSEGLPELERGLEAHASTCERCQVISARYHLLRQAVAAWGPAPVLSAESVERLRRLEVRRRPRLVVARWVRFVAPLATAAAVLVLVRVGGYYWPGQNPIATPAPVLTGAAQRPIGMALTEATSATIDLALEASAPAARLGRDVLGLEPTVNLPVEAEIELAETDVAASASEMLQTVGERVNAGVKPISGSARHAFSFLLGPPPSPDLTR